MPDREKVIERLEVVRNAIVDGYIHEPNRAVNAITDAITLLKEQEPIEPVDDGHGSLICGNQGFECGCVGSYNLRTKVVDKFCNFCPECGKQVKWRD